MKKMYALMLGGLMAASMAACSSAPATTPAQDQTAVNNQTVETPSANQNTTTQQQTQTETQAPVQQETQTQTQTQQPVQQQTQQAQTQTQTQQPAATQQPTTASAKTLKGQGDAIRAAFQNQGYSIVDLEVEFDEYSFTAIGNQGAVEISIQKEASGNAANWEYQDNMSIDIDESYTTLETITGQNTGNNLVEMTVMVNNFNGLYDIEGVDTANALVYSVDDAQQANMNTAKQILNSVMF